MTQRTRQGWGTPIVVGLEKSKGWTIGLRDFLDDPLDFDLFFAFAGLDDPEELRARP